MSTPEYEPSMPDGGDATQIDVNAPFAGHEFHSIYIVACTFIVFFILPGIGFLYSGLTRRKSAMTFMFQAFLILAVTTFQWIFWGYSLTYSRDGGPYIGTLKNFGLMDVLAAPSPGSAVLPEILFCMFQLLFGSCTVMIVIGGAFERGNIFSSLIFAFVWETIVYCPLARWTWSAQGWLYNLPSIDFAGGGPVHIASGCASLAYAVVLGKRKGYGEPSMKRPHNTTLVFLGTIFIWTGWLGFNGGSTLSASVRGYLAIMNTNVAASTGILGWVLVDMIRNKGKFSLVGACEGAIAGLVGITPAAGCVTVWLGALIGFLTAVVCSLCKNINDWMRVDEGMDVFKLHGLGGMVGSFLTGIFADHYISALDGGSLIPGAINGEGVQVGKQLAEICAISAYSFVMTAVILMIMKYIPYVGVRVSEEAEFVGLDASFFVDEQVGDWSVLEGIRSSPLMGVSQTPSEEVQQMASQTKTA
ncbi:ammonium transporter AmtB-like domain-containing protein [Aspergillus carlsbadensis]|nr:ammonium transporter AmtB-like domain-containing protein [Aspergillus carlsbadensis]